MATKYRCLVDESRSGGIEIAFLEMGPEASTIEMQPGEAGDGIPYAEFEKHLGEIVLIDFEKGTVEVVD